MVTIRVSYLEAQEILCWASMAKHNQEECGIKWDDDQKRTVTKIEAACHNRPSETPKGGKRGMEG